MNILLIGNGKWGERYIQTLNEFPNISLTVANRSNWKELVDKKPDGVIVATSPQSHIEIAKFVLERNIPTLIEKPLALSLSDALQLKQFYAPILVNHIHLFSNAYQYLKNVINPSEISGIASLGFNRGPHRDYSSLFDYGSHCIAEILDLTQSYPSKILCEKTSTIYGNLFKLKLKFNKFGAEGLVGNGGFKSVKKLKVMSNGIKFSYDDKEKYIKYIPPLINTIKVFTDAIDGKKDYRLGLDLSIDVIRILEECAMNLQY